MIFPPFSWSVSQSPIRVVIIIIMDHSYNNNNKWRSDAICNDPRVWINHGSTMDQHGSTWIKRPSACPPWLMCPKKYVPENGFSGTYHFGSCVQRPLTWQAFSVLTHGSCVQRPDSWLMRPASTHVAGVQRPDSWLMRPAS